MEILKTLKTVYDFINPILDALILAFIFYKCYQILVKTQAVQLLKGALSLALIYGLAFLFRLNTLTWLLNIIAPGIVMGIAIIFQPELRRIFMRIGQGEWIRIGVRTKHSHVDSALTAAEILSENRRGMLVVFIRRSGLKDII